MEGRGGHKCPPPSLVSSDRVVVVGVNHPQGLKREVEGWVGHKRRSASRLGVVVVGANTPPLLETRGGGECWAKKVDEEGENPSLSCSVSLGCQENEIRIKND